MYYYMQHLVLPKRGGAISWNEVHEIVDDSTEIFHSIVHIISRKLENAIFYQFIHLTI